MRVRKRSGLAQPLWRKCLKITSPILGITSSRIRRLSIVISDTRFGFQSTKELGMQIMDPRTSTPSPS